MKFKILTFELIDLTKLHEYLKSYWDMEADVIVKTVEDCSDYWSNPNEVIISDYWQFKTNSEVIYIEDITDYRIIANIIASYSIKTKGTFTDDLEIAKDWLKGIESKYDIIAVDFETKDLTLPQFNELTMVTIGWSLTKSIVIVFKYDEVKDYVLNWLITTSIKQVYHNSLFDCRLIHYYTGKYPKYIEDSQLLAQVYKNHIDESKRSVGLKALASHVYKDWANDKSSFDLYDTLNNDKVIDLDYIGHNDPNQYNLSLIKYCSIDSMATKLVWDMFDIEETHPKEWIMPTSEPKDNIEEFNQRYYYEFILKPAIPVIIDMLNNGQAIDLDKVYELKNQVESMKSDLMSKISEFEVVKNFHKNVDKERIDKFLKPIYKVARPKFTEYKHTPKDRTIVLNYIFKEDRKSWSIKDIKEKLKEL